jgi:SAM-dependent methyltransferase
MPLADPIAWYERNAERVAGPYEAPPPGRLYSWFGGLLSTAPCLVLDTGAGTGREAAWLARLGHDVIAVGPAAAMRAGTARLHPGPRIRWLPDAVFAAISLQRLRLRHDQQVPEWAG